MDPETPAIVPVGPVPHLPDGLEPPGAHAPTTEPAETQVVPPADPLPVIPPTVSRYAPSPSELAAFDAETSRLVGKAMDEIDEAQKEFDEVNSEAKAAKVRWQGLVEQQHKLIRERREIRGKPIQRTLLDYAPPTVNEVSTAPLQATTEPDPLENLWREFPLDRFTIWGMTDNDVKRLAEGQRKKFDPHPIATIGQLADFSSNTANPGFENRLTDFKGIGTTGADRITQATDHFWSWWRSNGQAEFAAERGIRHATQPGDGEGDIRPGDQGDGGEPGSPAVVGPHLEAEAPPELEDGPAVEPPGEGDEYSLTDAAA